MTLITDISWLLFYFFLLFWKSPRIFFMNLLNLEKSYHMFFHSHANTHERRRVNNQNLKAGVMEINEDKYSREIKWLLLLFVLISVPQVAEGNDYLSDSFLHRPTFTSLYPFCHLPVFPLISCLQPNPIFIYNPSLPFSPFFYSKPH